MSLPGTLLALTFIPLKTKLLLGRSSAQLCPLHPHALPSASIVVLKYLVWLAVSFFYSFSGVAEVGSCRHQMGPPCQIRKSPSRAWSGEVPLQEAVGMQAWRLGLATWGGARARNNTHQVIILDAQLNLQCVCFWYSLLSLMHFRALPAKVKLSLLPLSTQDNFNNLQNVVFFFFSSTWNIMMIYLGHTYIK